MPDWGGVNVPFIIVRCIILGRAKVYGDEEPGDTWSVAPLNVSAQDLAP